MELEGVRSRPSYKWCGKDGGEVRMVEVRVELGSRGGEERFEWVGCDARHSHNYRTKSKLHSSERAKRSPTLSIY